MAISMSEVEHIAVLSKLKFNDEEKQSLAGHMADIIEFANKISELDTSDIEPTNHVLDIKNVFRKDEVIESYNREELLKNAPSSEAGCIVVPNVVE